MSDSPDSDKVRASDADREATVKRLNDAFSEGRIELAELDERMQAAYSARTYRELRELESDLPARRRGLAHSGAIDPKRDPVAAYFNFRYQQIEWLRKLVARPPGQRGLAALIVGGTAIAAWVAVNVAYLIVCLAVGASSDSPLYTIWPLIAAPWGAVVLTTEIFRRLDRPE
jgi:uncharacterized protein DUF1707